MALNLDKIIADLSRAQTQANRANKQRYNKLLNKLTALGSQTGATFDEALGEIDDLGTAARTRVEQGKVRGQASAEQDLISRGLGNTTVRSSVRRGISDDAELQQQSIDEMVGSQRSGILQNRAGNERAIGGMTAGVMERRNDIGPDLSAYANLIRQAAGAGGGKVSASVGASTNPIPLSQSLRASMGGGGGSGGSPAGAGFPTNPGGGGGAGPNPVDTVTNPGGSLPKFGFGENVLAGEASIGGRPDAPQGGKKRVVENRNGKKWHYDVMPGGQKVFLFSTQA